MRGLREKTKLNEHQRRHGKKMGFKHEKVYNLGGIEFLSKPLGKNMEELLAEGKRLRYDYSTNEYGAVNPDGNMATYYWPDGGYEYWEGKIRDYGKKRR